MTNVLVLTQWEVTLLVVRQREVIVLVKTYNFICYRYNTMWGNYLLLQQEGNADPALKPDFYIFVYIFILTL